MNRLSRWVCPLRAQGRDTVFEQEWEDYLPLFERIVSIDLALCLKAVERRRAATARLPTMDSLRLLLSTMLSWSIASHTLRPSPVTC